MSEWQPIETAPKDIPILCFGRLRFYTTGTAMAVMQFLSEYGYWETVGASGHDVEEDVIPTHWTMLPAPPVQSNGSQP